jgi:uncharacterized protein YecT (DUF1311 family)
MATGSEQKQCVEIRYRRTADEMKGAYGQVLDQASKADIEHPASGDQKSWKTAVTESQRAWAYRDAESSGAAMVQAPWCGCWVASRKKPGRGPRS